MINSKKETKKILDDLFIGNEDLREEVEAYTTDCKYNTTFELLADVKRYLKARLIKSGITDKKTSESQRERYGLYETAGNFIFNVIDKPHRDALVMLYQLEDDDGTDAIDIDAALKLANEAVAIMQELLNE